LCVLLLVGSSAWGQGAAQFPDKPLRLVVTFAPGGNSDILARAVGPKLTEAWGKSVVVDNRAGGGGVIATEIVAKSAPDGYTILVGSTGELSINPGLFQKLPYDVERDFAPVTLGTVSPLLFIAHPTFPGKTIRELVELAKAKPGSISYASIGIGSPMHLAGELLKQTAGINLTHVPYKGGAPATAAVLGNEVPVGFAGIGPAIPHVRAGRARAIGVSTVKRATALPEVPTFAEQGLAGFDMSIWFAFVVPRATPRDVVSKLNGELTRVLRTPDTIERLTATGVDVVPTTPAALGESIRAESVKYKKVIDAAGIKPE
jgi:tripartite-type tricarboxylate transporter receptor subunit TctC